MPECNRNMQCLERIAEPGRGCGRGSYSLAGILTCAGSTSLTCQTFCTIRHLGKPSHPQNCLPSFDSLRAVRNTIFRPHRGHLRRPGAVLRFKFWICWRSVAHDGFIRFDSITVQIFATCSSVSMRVWNERTYRAAPKPTVTFCGISRLNSASPTNTTTDFTDRFGNPIPARASSIALTCP